jgi:hypothetical protein
MLFDVRIGIELKIRNVCVCAREGEGTQNNNKFKIRNFAKG